MDRYDEGSSVFAEVYGQRVQLPPRGAIAATDAMVEQLFGEVWSREALEIPKRRLLVIGVLAAGGHFEPLKIQFDRALDTGELTAAEVDEVVLHLAHYVGWPALASLVACAEEAKAAQREREQATS